MDLVDTNIFLEILFQQTRSADCEKYLHSHTGQLYLSTFSLHSIGVLLFKKKKANVFNQFLTDFPPASSVLSVSNQGYDLLPSVQSRFNLDFDDSYQFQVANENNLHLVTMDPDFKKVGSSLRVLFI